MEDPNEAFRGQPGSGHHPARHEFTLPQGQSSRHVSLSSSSSNNRGNVHARRQTNSNTSTRGLKTEPNAVNAENLWNATPTATNAQHNISQSINGQSSQTWPPVPGFSSEYIQPYGFPEGLVHGLPAFPNSHTVAPSMEFGSALGAAPIVDSSSSSSCRVNGSSPNTVFGSFSSSIGPPDMMDMDVTDECFHSPSAFPTDMPSCPNPGAIPQGLLSRSAVHNFGITPGVVSSFHEAETVSPKMLNLQNVPSLPSSSSSESLPNPFRMDSDSDVTSAVVVPQEQTVPSSASQVTRRSGPKLNSAGRKQLPDKAPHSKPNESSQGPKRRHGGEASGDKSSAPSSKKSKAKAKGSSETQSQAQEQPQPASSHRRHHKGGSEPRTKSSHGKASSSKAATGTASNTLPTDESSLPTRSEKDDFLVKHKQAGMTYREIRKKGGFTEAESTLRGRFRTLTKPKEARVRKPEFQEIDVSSLLSHRLLQSAFFITYHILSYSY